MLEDGAREKIREYRADYANNRGIPFMPMVVSTSGRVHSELARLLFLQAHRETTKYFEAHGRQLAQNTHSDSFHFKRAAFYNAIKSKVGLAVLYPLPKGLAVISRNSSIVSVIIRKKRGIVRNPVVPLV